MDYLLKSSAVIILFYICYRFFLQRETFFIGNRWFLLLGLLSSMLVPLIVIPVYVEFAPIVISDAMMYQDTVTIQPPTENAFDMFTLIPWLYGIGVIFFLGKLAMELMSLFHLIKKHPIKKGKSFVYIKTDTLNAPFSFYNWIFYNPKQFDNNELQLVMNHEKVHARQLHTLDVHFVQFACAIMWFNPVMWMYKKALLQNLEFIADQEAQRIANCEKSYQNLLLKTSISNHQLALTNNFYNSLIKNRILMLHKSKSKKINAYKYALVIPLLLLFVFNFNTEIIAQTPKNKTEETAKIGQNILKFIITKDTKDKQLELIKTSLAEKDVEIKFDGIKRNSKDEIIAISIGYQSKISKGNHFVNSENPINSFEISLNVDEQNLMVGQSSSKLTQSFEIIKEDGETKLQKSDGNNTDEDDGIIIINNTNDNKTSKDTVYIRRDVKNIIWTDVSGKETKINASENGNKAYSFMTQSGGKSLIIVDGKESSAEKLRNMETINFKTVDVIKGQKGIDSYGKKGENGVIMITTKNDASFSGVDKAIVFKNNQEKPLVIVDGKKITSDELANINPNSIVSVDVLKDKAATKPYGEDGKNGVILVTTTKTNHTERSNELNNKKGPWEIGNTFEVETREVESGLAEKYNGPVIFMETKEKALNEIKKNLKSEGVIFNYSKLKRNSKGNITNIKVELSDGNGKTMTATYANDDGISGIYMGIKSGNLFLNTGNK